MRLIEMQMLDAIDGLAPKWKSGNTEVNTINIGKTLRVNVYLHNNHIAQVDIDKDEPHRSHVRMMHCGYPSRTTASRLNAIATRLCLASVSTSYGFMMVTEELEPRYGFSVIERCYTLSSDNDSEITLQLKCPTLLKRATQ